MLKRGDLINYHRNSKVFDCIYRVLQPADIDNCCWFYDIAGDRRGRTWMLATHVWRATENEIKDYEEFNAKRRQDLHSRGL